MLHVASPFPPAQPKDPDELIVPAHDGTLRVLETALEAGAQRVVVTSSSAAVRNPGAPDLRRPLTETDWANPGNPKLSPYARSKMLAERSAWDYTEQNGAAERLTVINPGAIIGPLLGDHRVVLGTDRRAAPDGQRSCDPPSRLRIRRRQRRRRPAHPRHYQPPSRRPAVLGAGPFTWMTSSQPSSSS